MAKGQSYFQLGGMSISPDNKLAIFSIDIVGRRIYTIQVKNLETNEILEDKIENTYWKLQFGQMIIKPFFILVKMKLRLRSDKIFKHKLGTNAS